MVAATLVRPYGAIWNLSEFTGSTGKFLYSIFLESRSVLVVKFCSAYITSTGVSKYIKIEKNHHDTIFKNSQNFALPLKFYHVSRNKLHSPSLKLSLQIFSLNLYPSSSEPGKPEDILKKKNEKFNNAHHNFLIKSTPFLYNNSQVLYTGGLIHLGNDHKNTSKSHGNKHICINT